MRSEIDEVLDTFPALDRPAEPAGRPAVGRSAPAAAIARTLLTKPRLLILDEPTEGIQPNVVAEIEQVIVDLTRRGDLTVLLVEQHVGFALRSTDRYYVLESGRITGSGDGGEAALDEVRAAMAGVDQRRMHLTMHEQERLLISLAAMVARDRMARGVKLNYPEAVAILCSCVLEGAARAGAVADLMDAGRRVLDPRRRDGRRSPRCSTEVQIEATFPDGTKLVTIHTPIP